MRVLTTRSRWLFAAAWALATTVTFTASGFLFHFPGALPPNNGDSFNASGFLGALINGMLTGALVGLGQMFLLRTAGLSSWRWAAGTAVALWLIHTVGDVLTDPLATPLMVLLGGFLLGGLQWWALQWPPRQGLPWLIGNTVAWSLGMWLSRLSGDRLDWRAEHVLVGVVTGLLLGLATALLWLRMLPQGRERDRASR